MKASRILSIRLKASQAPAVRRESASPRVGKVDSDIQEVSSIKTLRTKSNKIRRLLWIVSFCKEEPALRSFAFWCQGLGAIAHPSLFVRFEEADGVGYRLLVDRPISAGTTLLSIPLPQRRRRMTELYAGEEDIHISEKGEYRNNSCVVHTDDSDDLQGTAAGHPVTQLVHSISRGVTEASHPQHFYLRFLHDHYNAEDTAAGEDDADDDGEEFLSLAASASSADYRDALETLRPPPMPVADPYGEARALARMEAHKQRYHLEENAAAKAQMRSDVEALSYNTNILMMGVPNAPYLELSAFETPRAKAELVRMQRIVRTLKQGLPFFTIGAVPWAMSMIMSRALSMPEVPYSPPKSTRLFIPYGRHDFTQHSSSSQAPSDLRDRSLEQLYSSFTAAHIDGATKISALGKGVGRHPFGCAGAGGQRATPLLKSMATDIQASNPCLVPLLDFCNHSPQPTAHYCVTFPGTQEIERHAKAVQRRRERIAHFRLLKRQRRLAKKHHQSSAIASNQEQKSCAEKIMAAVAKKDGAATLAEPKRPARMLSNIVGVKGWHYWRPCVHLVAISDMAKYDEVTLKYAEDSLLYGKHVGEAAGAETDPAKNESTLESIREGFKFRYGFEPPLNMRNTAVVPTLSEVAQTLENQLEKELAK